MSMIRLFESAYVIGPFLIVALAGLTCAKKRHARVYLASLTILIVLAWSYSVYNLSCVSRVLETKWFERESDVKSVLGRPYLREKMPEGDEYIVYVVRVRPWKIIAVYNIYRGKVLSATRAEDLSAALDAIRDRPKKISDFVKSTLRQLDEEAK